MTWSVPLLGFWSFASPWMLAWGAASAIPIAIHLFSRRTRDLPSPMLPTGLEPKDSLTLNGRVFRLFERYTAEIAYVEGELTWIAKLGDQVRVAEAIDPPGMFIYEQSDAEWEYSLGEYLDPGEVHAAFALAPPAKPAGIHPAQPFDGGRILPALAKVGPIFAAVALLGLIAVAAAGGGRELIRSDVVTSATEPSILPFTVADADRLLKLRLSAPISNNWVYYEVTISDAASGREVLSLGKEISFYEGRDSDGYWREGSRGTSALFKLPAAGDYRIEIVPREAGSPVPDLEVRLYDQVLVKRYLVMLFVLAAAATVALPIYRRHFENQRWRDVLEDDDD